MKKKKKVLRPKTINVDTLNLSMEKNPLGSPFIGNILRRRRFEDLIKNPRKYRKD